jgi:hypothetical protein
MSEPQQPAGDPFSFLTDAIWASLPEKTAEEIATFKKDVLKAVRGAIDRFIDNEIEWTDHHLENARRMREQYANRESENPPPDPA